MGNFQRPQSPKFQWPLTPVREEAIKAIGARSLAIDVYVWLAYRLHSLSRLTPLSWTAIHGQFGGGFRAVRHLKPVFLDALRLALAVYPEAWIDVCEEKLVLHPSPPAVPRRKPAGSALPSLESTALNEVNRPADRRLQLLHNAGPFNQAVPRGAIVPRLWVFTNLPGWGCLK